MKEWKIRQEIYHRLNNEYRDDLNKIATEHKINIDYDNVVSIAINHFINSDIGWEYPAKSYVVAICYAKWLEQYFNENFYEVLNDPSLLNNNDPYFVPYLEAKVIYDSILENITFDDTAGKIPDIKQYFLEEFLLNENGEPLAD